MASTPDPSYWGNPPRTPDASGPLPTAPMPPEEPRPEGRSSTARIAIVIVAILGVLGIAAFVTGCSALALVSDDYQHRASLQLPSESSAVDGETAAMNDTLRDSFGLAGTGPITEGDLSIIEGYFSQNETEQHEDGAYEPGVFRVGTDIPAGRYWFTGDDSAPSAFYILRPDEKRTVEYNVAYANTYYGHNLMDVDDGEILIIDNEGLFMPIDEMKETFEPPYGNGVYRVGVDIPAGSYALSLGPNDDLCAYSVMKDLRYLDSSYIDQGFYVEGDGPGELTLSEGTYVELYNMTLTPLSA